MSFSFGVALLAAGASVRMGRPKMLLAWGGTSILGHVVTQWRTLNARQVGVVCAPGDGALQAELDRIAFPPKDRIFNPAPARGMFSSVQAAATWTGWERGFTHIVLTLGDQPHLPLEALERLLAFCSQRPGDVCQPSRGGRPRHPVILPRSVFEALATSQHQTFKDFLAGLGQPAALCELHDPAFDLDLDTPDEYATALRRFGPGAAHD